MLFGINVLDIDCCLTIFVLNRGNQSFTTQLNIHIRQCKLLAIKNIISVFFSIIFNIKLNYKNEY